MELSKIYNAEYKMYLSDKYQNTIPKGYADVSKVTAAQNDVDEGKIFVTQNGQQVTGNSTAKHDLEVLNSVISSQTIDSSDVTYGVTFVNKNGQLDTGTSNDRENLQELEDKIISQTATTNDVDQNVTYIDVNGDITQGTSTYKYDYQTLNNMVDTLNNSLEEVLYGN